MISDMIIREYIGDLINDLRVFLTEENVSITQRREITRWAIIEYKKRIRDLNACENWNDVTNNGIHILFDKILVDIEIEAVDIAKNIKANERKQRYQAVVHSAKKAFVVSFIFFVTVLTALIFFMR